MEAILQGLQSNQIPTKVKALEDLVTKLENPKLLINATVSIHFHSQHSYLISTLWLV